MFKVIKTKKNMAEKMQKRVFNLGVIIKIAVLGLLFVVANILFGIVCNNVYNQYSGFIIFNLSSIGLLFLVLLAFGFVIFMAGLIAAFFRPWWVMVIAFFLSYLALLITMRFNITAILMGFLYFILAIIFGLYVSRELNNRINFSVLPIQQGQKYLVFGLALVVSLNFALGYSDDAQKRGFVIPPEYKEKAMSLISSILGAQVEKAIPMPNLELNGLPPEIGNELNLDLMSGLQEQTTKGAETMWNDIENGLKPFMQIIAIVLGLTLFLAIETLWIFVSWIIFLMWEGAIALLKLLGVIKVEKTMREVKRFVL